MCAAILQDHIAALHRAIRYFGSQRSLARQLKIDPVIVNNWLNRNKRIPLHYAEWIERLTDGAIQRYELAPYAAFLDNVKPVSPTHT